MRKLILGKNAILENINKSIVSIHSIGYIQKIGDIAKEKNIPYFPNEKKTFFENLNVNHKGIVAFLEHTDYVTNDFEKWYLNFKNSKNLYKIVVVLDGIEDVGNFGAIIRSCDCFGVDGIIIKNSRQAPINEIVIKNSMGAIYNSNILMVSNLKFTIDKLKELDFWTVSTTLEDAKNYNDLSYNFNCCLIMGNENSGVSAKIIESSDYKVKIPMFGITSSLNVSVSTGILLSYIKIKK